MMLLTIDGCYLVDRSFRFRRVQMRFPFRHPTEVSNFPSLLAGCVLKLHRTSDFSCLFLVARAYLIKCTISHCLMEK